VDINDRDKMKENEILGTQQLAVEARLTEGRIRQLIGEGRIKATRLGARNHVITRAEANRFLAEHARESAR
jgi:hypothetical protein